MSVDAILASGLPFNVVFQGTFDISPPSSNDKRQKLENVLGRRSRSTVVNDSQVYLSMYPVRGLSTIDSIIERPFFEEYLSEAFTSEPNYAATALKIHVDDCLKIVSQSLINRTCAVYIGYTTDAWADYELWFTGKTTGGVRKGYTLTLNLSSNPVITQNVWPTETFDDGRCIPVVLGTVNKINPVPTGTDGLWRFHNGTVNDINIPVANNNPYVEFDSDSDTFFGDFTFTVNDANTSESDATATDALPSNVTEGDGSITSSGGLITMTLPDDNSLGSSFDFCQIEIDQKDEGDGSLTPSGLYARDVWTVQLNSSSTVSEVTLGAQYVGVSTAALTLVRERVTQIVTTEYDPPLNARLKLLKGAANNADTVKVDIISMRREFIRNDTADCQVYDADGKKYPTAKVGDATEITSVKGVCLYDNNGYLATPEDFTNFSMDAVGDDATTKSIAALNQIVDEATGSQVSLTAAFTGEDVGYYATQQLPSLEHVRELAKGMDLIPLQNLTDDDLTVERRYNHQPSDFDGDPNNTAQFTINQQDIIAGSISQGAVKRGAARYVVQYGLWYSALDQSPTKTGFSTKGVLSQTKTIKTYLKGGGGAAENIASLVTRDNEVLPVSFVIMGQGHGIRVNDVGRIYHPELRNGISHIRKVRQVGTNTEITVDIYVS